MALLNDKAGCGHYRVIHPLTILQRHGALVHLIQPLPPEEARKGKERIIPDEVWEGANVVLLQRTSDPRILNMVGDRERRKRIGYSVIYESDDDVIHIDPKNPAAHRKGKDKSGTHHPELIRNIERIAREADALFVSTPELAAQWSHLNRKTFVLPNSIDFSIRKSWEFPVERQVGKEGDVVIGWAGGVHHVGDQKPVIGVLPDILRRSPQAHLGICSNPTIMAAFLADWGMGTLLQVPPRHRPDSVIKQQGLIELQAYPEFQGRWSKIDPVPFDIYPFVVRQFDIGLAPLEDHSFNRSKSALRLLEYGAVGVPYVASPLPSYVQFHRESHGRGGFIARTKQEWSEAITHLVENTQLREDMSAAIKAYVREHCNTDQVGLQWADAIRRVWQGGVSTWTPRERPGRNHPCPCGSGKKYKFCCLGVYG